MIDKDMCVNCAFKNKCKKCMDYKQLEKKLDIAVKALNEIRNEAENATWNVNARWLIGTVNGAFFDIAKIKEIK